VIRRIEVFNNTDGIFLRDGWVTVSCGYEEPVAARYFRARQEYVCAENERDRDHMNK
jgi:hypothetical protein